MESFAHFEHGAEVGGYPSNERVDVERSVTVAVSFSESERGALGDAITLPVDYLLEEILTQLTDDILPGFENALKGY